MKYLGLFDNLNVPPKFYIRKREKYSSKFGICLGLLAFIACFGFSVYFIFDYYKKEDGNVIFNEITDFKHELNMTEIPFIFKLTNSRGNSYSDSLVNFNFQHWILPSNSSGVPIVNSIPYEKCDYNKHFLSSKYQKFFMQMDFESYYCLNLNKYDLSLDGSFGDTAKGYSYINLYINECIDINNKIIDNNKVVCEEKNKILQKIGDLTLYLQIAYIDFQIDHSDYSNPYKPYLKLDRVMFTYKSKSRVFYYFKNVFYYTDIGLLEKNNQLEKFSVFENFEITYPMVTFQVPEAFGVLSILIAKRANEFKKSFSKIQTLIANIGGVIKGITLVFEFFVHVISDKLVFIYYSNCIVDFKGNLDERTNKRVNQGISKRSTLKLRNEYLYHFNKSKTFNKVNFYNSNDNLNISSGLKKEIEELKANELERELSCKPNTRKFVMKTNKNEIKELTGTDQFHKINENLDNNSHSLIKEYRKIDDKTNKLEEQSFTKKSPATFLNNYLEPKEKSKKIDLHDEKFKLETTKKGNYAFSELKKINEKDYILPLICFPKFNLKKSYYRRVTNLIKEKLSIENILKSNIKNEILRHVILNEKELELFENIPKAKLNVLEYLDPVIENKMSAQDILKQNNFVNERSIKRILGFYDN